MSDKRFEKIYKQSGFADDAQIWVDRETGVNYLLIKTGYGAGVTPLLDANGKPIVTPKK